jgi:hypothetical protein
MKQTTATRRVSSVFHRTVARKQLSIEESTTEDRARRDIERLEWTGKGQTDFTYQAQDLLA